MLRSDSTRGSINETASSMATISSGSSSVKPQRAALRAASSFGAGGDATPEILASDKRRPPLRKLVERHGEHDDDAEEDRLNARIDAQQVHRIGQGEQKDGAQRHHFDPADAAFDADAGDHRRGDAFQRQLQR